MHRANATRQGPNSPGSNRIFRQGYEFVETLSEGQLRLGLNFVSFQRDLANFTGILRSPGWMEAVNFGGRAQAGEPRPIDFVSIIAGGYYAVPPQASASEPFPGAGIFG